MKKVKLLLENHVRSHIRLIVNLLVDGVFIVDFLEEPNSVHVSQADEHTKPLERRLQFQMRHQNLPAGGQCVGSVVQQLQKVGPSSPRKVAPRLVFI